MQFKTVAMVLLTMCAATGCKKKGGSGGGGGGWLVGESGLMANIGIEGGLGAGYNLGSTERLLGISCEGLDTAYVVGAHGLVMRTTDAGTSWSSIDAGTSATLRSVAAWNDSSHVYAVGDGAFLASNDGGETFRSVTTQPANWLAVASDWRGTTALAISDDSKVWRFDGTTASPQMTLAGARTIAVSHDGAAAVAVGSGVWRSLDGGFTWTALDVGAVDLQDAWVEADGRVTAVGAAGTVVHVAADGTARISHAGSKTLRTVYVAADGFGVTAGDDGATFLTYDAGATWEQGPNVGHTVYAVDQIGLNELQ